MKVTIGADPEIFAEDLQGNLRSVIGKIGGSKNNPQYIDDHGGFALQEDNVACEYNIPPAQTKEQFIEYIQWPQQVISKLLQTEQWSISTKASGMFDAKELQHPKAKEFGCDPDFNAWTLEQNPRPKAKSAKFRSCGGHIHLGLENKNNAEIIRIVRAMDKTLGTWSVIVDKDQDRRQLYGKAGAFRPQEWGLEYRTLSNFWIFSKDLISEVYDRVLLALQQPMIDGEEGLLIQQIINKGDHELARSYLQSNGL